MAFKMKGSELYGKLKLNRKMDKSSKPDGRAKSSAFQKDEKVVKGKTYDAVEVSGGKKTTFDDKNAVLTAAELKKRKINPAPNTKYYRNKKTGRISTIDWSKK